MVIALIIDDSLYTLKRHTSLVQEAGMTAMIADNGMLALEMYQDIKPNIVLCDIMMPEMDGYEVFDALKKIDPNVFLYFISAERTTRARERALEMGAIGFYQKPVDVATMKEILVSYNNFKPEGIMSQKQPNSENQTVKTTICQISQEIPKSDLENSLPEGFSDQGEFIYCEKDESLMLYIPAGKFVMGDDKIFNARPTHEVYLNGYFIDRHPITNKQYAKFIAAGGYENPIFWSSEGWAIRSEEQWEKPRYWNDAPWNEEDRPVVGISWFEAEAYSNWANKQLPTEAQWEKAARGGIWLDGDALAKQQNPNSLRKYPWGDTEPNQDGIWRAIYQDEPSYGNKSTAPVGLAKAGISPYGCLDMSGNVWEWCRDWYQRDYYKLSPSVNPLGASTGELKILRGGSWCRPPKQLQVSFRTKDDPTSGGWDLSGFRCVKTLETVHD